MTSIIFIHRGNSWYLPYTLWQCRATNPDADIYLIGDKSTAHFDGLIKHVNIDEYSNAAHSLKTVYRHKSILGADFELACIERWFILAAFLDKHHIENCVYLDSDILVYDELSQFEKKFKDSDMTWCSFSAHVNFISHVSALHKYCQLVINSYNNSLDETCKAGSLFTLAMQKDSGLNVSDMTFFYDYNKLYPQSLRAIDIPTEGIACFDISMEDTREFSSNGNGFKQVKWEEKQPFCKYLATETWVPMAALHFQGRAKKLIPLFFRYSSVRFRLYKLRNDLLLGKMLLINKIKKEMKSRQKKSL